ncbi:hypothetical protein Q1M62_02810 (plasmid) [Sinorhizobium meliloti]|nr:hypothetical protein Q1M62_02810 [Sinorhizobium meliloti]
MLFVKDFYDALDSESEMDISSLVHGVPVVSDLADAMQVIESIRKSPVHMVLAPRTRAAVEIGELGKQKWCSPGQYACDFLRGLTRLARSVEGGTRGLHVGSKASKSSRTNRGPDNLAMQLGFYQYDLIVQV